MANGQAGMGKWANDHLVCSTWTKAKGRAEIGKGTWARDMGKGHGQGHMGKGTWARAHGQEHMGKGTGARAHG